MKMRGKDKKGGKLRRSVRIRIGIGRTWRNEAFLGDWERST
jgi:hypothetical protein